ncbi:MULTISPECIES: elongation factor P 5-aminopentanone reductase [Bacillus]|uniref:3-ketoacyl-ACP reductase n=2 Tax=Bacillus TaxID=1386 RepID=A0A0M4FFI9_9BACI|nr:MULTISPECIES: SDR family oxidoreductase [Bacillus]ALC81111.1 3-ketoacyl-ACP reductase [Bacillus gobiensis]MBP1080076.1 3-oxoacyl-[acyl-carrier protein] reductase [Bacillus capparidis]MED1095465.1 SDR family oxidoreductase [Bacillus capparidis]
MKKAALVTGASGGIGQRVAESLAENNYNLYLHYHQNHQAASRLAEKLNKQFDVSATLIQCDFSSKTEVNRISDEITTPLDAIVLTSGISRIGLITDMTDELVEEMIHIHVSSPFKLIRNLLPPMISRKKGSIVVISSIWGETGAACEVLYSMAKGAQHSFVKALAKELAPSGIRVNAVAPGAINTAMNEQFSDEEIRMMSEEIPMGRLGKPNEIAGCVEFLLSEKSSYVTGQILSANGGWLC